METTDSMSLEDAAMSLLETQSDETEAETEEAEEDQTDEAPDAELDDEEEAEEETDDADDGETVEDEDEDDTEDAGQEEPGFFTVPVDGEEVQVTLEDLKRSYSGQSYIQKGMQEAAAKKKEAEQLSQQLQQEREQFSQFVQSVQQNGFAQEPQKPDLTMLETDPIGYWQQKAAYDEAKEQFDQQQQQFQYLQHQQAEAQKQQMRAYKQEQQRLLHEAIPELSDAEKAGKVKQELVSAGTSYGFTEEEISTALDHRVFKVLNDAMKYRQLQKSQASKKAEKTRPAVKPKAKQKQNPAKLKREQQAKRLKQSGSIYDAIDLMFEGE